MSQFYNDTIEKRVDLLTLYLIDLDSKLNVMIGNLFIDYTVNARKRTQTEFKKEFYKIYNVDSVKQEREAIAIFEAQNDINIKEEETKLLTIYEKKYRHTTYDNLNQFTKLFKEKIIELESRSYHKYLDALKSYDNEVNNLWTK